MSKWRPGEEGTSPGRRTRLQPSLGQRDVHAGPPRACQVLVWAGGGLGWLHPCPRGGRGSGWLPQGSGTLSRSPRCGVPLSQAGVSSACSSPGPARGLGLPSSALPFPRQLGPPAIGGLPQARDPVLLRPWHAGSGSEPGTNTDSEHENLGKFPSSGPRPPWASLGTPILLGWGVDRVGGGGGWGRGASQLRCPFRSSEAVLGRWFLPGHSGFGPHWPAHTT